MRPPIGTRLELAHGLAVTIHGDGSVMLHAAGVAEAPSAATRVSVFLSPADLLLVAAALAALTGERFVVGPFSDDPSPRELVVTNDDGTAARDGRDFVSLSDDPNPHRDPP